MPVRRQNGGERTVPNGPVQIARDEEPGQALEVHLRDAIIGVSDLAEDHRRQGRLLGDRQQAGGREHVLPEVVGSMLPLTARRDRRRRKVIVEGAVLRRRDETRGNHENQREEGPGLPAAFNGESR